MGTNNYDETLKSMRSARKPVNGWWVVEVINHSKLIPCLVSANPENKKVYGLDDSRIKIPSNHTFSF